MNTAESTLDDIFNTIVVHGWIQAQGQEQNLGFEAPNVRRSGELTQRIEGGRSNSRMGRVDHASLNQQYKYGKEDNFCLAG